MKKVLVFAAVAAALLSGCGTGEPTPVKTVTVAVPSVTTAAPTVAVTPTPTPTPVVTVTKTTTKVVTPKPKPKPRSSGVDCGMASGYRVTAHGTASCPFAVNIGETWAATGYDWLYVWSPVTKTSYDVHCVGYPVKCTWVGSSSWVSLK